MFSEKKRCMCLLLVLACCFYALALGESSAVLTEQEAVWEDGGYVKYAGSFLLEEDVSDAVWHAELKTGDPDEAGEVVFTRIREDSVKKRKQSDTMKAEAVKGENSFEITWYLPEKMGSLSGAEISFRLEDGSGQTLAAGQISRNTGGEDSSDRAVRLLSATNRVMVILLIAAGVIWACAVLRIILARKRRGSAKA